jgi:hypothetical protein
LITTGIDNEITADRIKPYLERLAEGQYLVVVKGTDAEIDRAGTVLQASGIQDWKIFEQPA